MKLTISDYHRKDGTPDPNRRRVTRGDLTVTLLKRGRFWETRIMLAGERHHLNLRTGCLKTAARTAIDKARAALGEQWDFVHRGRTQRGLIKLGEICERYLDQLAPRAAAITVVRNVPRFKSLVRIGLGLKRGKCVDHLPASILDGDLVKQFQAAYVKGYPEGEAAEARKRGANGMLADARSLFTKGIMADELYPDMPDISKFILARHLPAVPVAFRYEAIEEWVEKLFANLPQLKLDDPAVYLYFRLCAVLGLRRREALEARKGWVTTRRGHRVIYIQPTDGWIPKGRRERKVPLPEDLYNDILLLSDSSEFIVPIATRNANHKTNHGVSRRLNLWMTGLGWPFKKKAHELRRWFGAQVATQTGSLFAAQRLLGHASPATTNQYYADLVDAPEYKITTETANVPPSKAEYITNISC
jgi:integrase